MPEALPETGEPLRVEVWQAPLPLGDGGMQTVAGTFTHFYHLLILVQDSEGHTGAGYSAFHQERSLLRAAAAAIRLLKSVPLTLSVFAELERLADSNDPNARGNTVEARSDPARATQSGEPRAIRHAVTNAIGLAAADLLAQRAGVACADLWDRRAEVDALSCYASGFFLHVPQAGLPEEAERYRSLGYRLAKMRSGHSVDVDLMRLQAVRTVFPEPATVAVDAVQTWDPASARTFVERARCRLLWLEDPTTDAQLQEMSGCEAFIAAGESCETTDALLALRTTGKVDGVLLDVQRLGGPAAFLGAAHRLSAAGARIGAHMFHHFTPHLLAVVDNPLPVEILDWADPLFEEAPRPDVDGRLSVRGPGFGNRVNQETLTRYGTLAARLS